MKNRLPVVNRQTIVGEPEQVRNVLRNAYANGTLVKVHDFAVTNAGRMMADVDLRQVYPTATYGRPVRSKRPYLIGGAVAGVLAVLAALGWLVAVAVAWVAANIGVILGGAVALVVLLALLHVPASAAGCCPCHRK